jgi:tetratricopeptide (TPR) repeat protein
MRISPFAFIALLGWLPFVVALFAFLPGRRAAAIAVIGAWLLLPPITLDIAGLPDYSKNAAASVGMMLGTFLFAPDRLLNFRPRWYDLPMLLWCLCGIASSLQNGLGPYDGLSNSLGRTLLWGLPYLLGRLYFNDAEGLRSFVVAMVVGGLCYVLPCLWEVKQSPQLMGYVYGIWGWSGLRLGGYRPQVFFNTGLECGMWMTAAALAAWWMWRCGALERIGQVPLGTALLPILLVTTVFCRSTGALVLLVCGVGILWLSTRFRTRLLLVALLLVGPLYVSVRVTNFWSGQQAVDLAKAVAGPDRAQSLEYRFMCEDLLAAHSLKQPTFGWGGFNRGRPYFKGVDPSVLESEYDKNRMLVPVDGMWIGILSSTGFVGLTLFYTAMILPAIRFVRRFPARLWGDPRLAAGSLAAVLLGVYMIDCLMNGFVNIIYITLAGGLMGLEPGRLGAAGADRRGARVAGRRPDAPAIAAARPASGRLVLADRCRTLGRSCKQSGRPDEAEAAWRQALDILTGSLQADGADPEVRRRWCDCANDLAWLRANHPESARRDPASALALARQIVEECPDSAAYWNTLGVAHYRAGDPRSAVAALGHARALGGGTAFDDVFLAMAHARLGESEQARQALARALVRAERDYPGHPELAGFCDEAGSLIAGAATPVAGG